MRLEELLLEAVRREASDVHLRADRRPVLRVHGALQRTDHEPVTARAVEETAQRIMSPEKWRESAESAEVDFAYEAPSIGRFRVNAFRERGNLALVLRRVLPTVPTFEDLGLPPVLRQIAEEPHGLVLVTGRTGSGKTTTLASMIEHMNRTRDQHIVTVEDPIEFQFVDRRCTISQREVGTDTADFRAAVKRVLRQDPDVIFIGEMRDPETVWTAMSAAETGHLVLSSLHTATATETVHRIIDFFSPSQHRHVRSSLASSLRAIVSQRLVPRADGLGRVPAVEILRSNGRIFERIVDAERTHQIDDVIAESGHYGMCSFDQSLAGLCTRGVITRAVALEHATHPHDLRLTLDGMEGPSHPAETSMLSAG